MYLTFTGLLINTWYGNLPQELKKRKQSLTLWGLVLLVCETWEKNYAYFMFSVQKWHPFFRGSTTEQKHSEKKTLPEWCFHLSWQKAQRRYLRAFCTGNSGREMLSRSCKLLSILGLQVFKARRTQTAVTDKVSQHFSKSDLRKERYRRCCQWQ